MTLVDRDELSRCCALLAGLTWMLAIGALVCVAMTVHEVGSIPGISAETATASQAAAAQAVSASIAVPMLSMFAVAIAVFVLLAMAPFAAGLALVVGLKARKAGAHSMMLVWSQLAAALYLTATTGLLIRTSL